MQCEIIKALDKEIKTLQRKCNQNRRNIKSKTKKENYRLIKQPPKIL